MLDKIVFATCLKELASYHKREISLYVQRIWYKHLQDLTTEQFEKAIETAFVKCNFMPTPEDLLEFAGSGMKQKISHQWSLVNDARKRFPAAPDSVREYDKLIDSLQLDCVALKALHSLGGLGALSRLNDESLSYKETKFAELYRLWDAKRDELEVQHQEQLALRAAQALAALPPSDLQPMPVDLGERMEGLKSAFAMPKEPEPERVLETIEERQAKNQAVLQHWREQGLLNQEQKQQA